MHIQPYKAQRNRRKRTGEQGLSTREERGFTLAEVMVAVFVLTTMALSLYAGFSSGFMIVDSARADLRASQILTQKAESIRLCTWSALASCPISFVESYDPSAYGSGGGGTIYTGTVTTNTATSIRGTAAYKTNMGMVNLTIYWTNYTGQQSSVHSRSMQTLVARYGIQNYIWGTGP